MEREELIDVIKDRVRIMSETCSAIRTLANVFVFWGAKGILVLELAKLTANWDIERTTYINNEKFIYVDFNNFKFFTRNFELTIDEIDDEDLKALYDYFCMMIPKPPIYDEDRRKKSS